MTHKSRVFALRARCGFNFLFFLIGVLASSCGKGWDKGADHELTTLESLEMTLGSKRSPGRFLPMIFTTMHMF